MQNAVRVSVSPIRGNIRLGRVSATTEEQKLHCLDWIAEEVKAKGASMLPILVYCNSIPAVGLVYCHLKAELEQDAWVDGDPDQKAETQLIGIVHAKTLPQTTARVIASLKGQGNCRVVVCTTALGMGLNFG